MHIFGLQTPELIVILLIVLLLFGPKNLPKLGRSLGNTIKGFRKEMNLDDDDKKTDANQSDDEIVIEEDTEDVEDIDPSSTAYCANCGAKISPNDEYCRSCGNKINNQ